MARDRGLERTRAVYRARDAQSSLHEPQRQLVLAHCVEDQRDVALQITVLVLTLLSPADLDKEHYIEINM